MVDLLRFTPPTLDDLATALRAVAVCFAGPTEPEFPQQGQLWLDTTTSKLKFYASGTAGWTVLIADSSVGHSGSLAFPVKGFSGTTTVTLGSMPACTVSGVYLSSSTATTSDGSNLYTLQLRNETQSLNLLSAAKSTNGSDIAANTAYRLIANQNLTVSYKDVLSLVVTATGSPTSLASASMSITLDYTLV